MTTLERRSRLARTRGPDETRPLNQPDADTPGWPRPRAKRYTTGSIHGEEREELLRRLRELAKAALTDFEIANELGVSTWMLQWWCDEDPAFAAALDLPKALADRRVERALYHRAVGYSYRSEKIIKRSDDTIVRVPVIEHVPPDVKAAETWLHNRKPEAWSSRQDLKLADNINMQFNEAEQDPRKLAMAVLATLREGMGAIPAPEPEDEE